MDSVELTLLRLHVRECVTLRIERGAKAWDKLTAFQRKWLWREARESDYDAPG